MHSLSDPSHSFQRRKSKILAQLAIPDSQYTDLSPKGSVDIQIRDLIDEINQLDGFVTTSSCAGRVSVFVEGRKAGDEDSRTAANVASGAGGKGGGGSWLFVSHDPVLVGEGKDVREMLGLKAVEGLEEIEGEGILERPRLIHFKFEPMILHVLTASLGHAQLLLKCGLQAGFRESGAIDLIAKKGDEAVMPMVAIRSMGLGLESLVGMQRGNDIQSTVSTEYLHELVTISYERFAENTKRINRFRSAIQEAIESPKKGHLDGWEDPEARRQRKKAEGLRRKAELEARHHHDRVPAEDDALNFSLNTNFT